MNIIVKWSFKAKFNLMMKKINKDAATNLEKYLVEQEKETKLKKNKILITGAFFRGRYITCAILDKKDKRYIKIISVGDMSELDQIRIK